MVFQKPTMRIVASRAPRWCIAQTMLAAALACGCDIYRYPASATDPAATVPISPAPQPAGPSTNEDALVAQGQSLFKNYKCHECHGPHGEGTDDAPDLIGTHLNAAEIAAFLQKPSAHARSVGIPSLPAASPDLQPLVAFVLSLKRPISPD